VRTRPLRRPPVAGRAIGRPSSSLDAVFAALAHPVRRAIFERLTEHEATVSELAAPFQMSLPAVSRHLRVLDEAGLIVREKRGRDHHCRPVHDPLLEAIGWIVDYGAFWEQQLDSLAALLARSSGRSEA
jgi:DNA-binding transcriptional ArsR family regulator